MADETEVGTGSEDGKSRLVPILLGVAIVVGMAIGLVAFTAPPAPAADEQTEVDLDTLPSRRWDEPFEWTFNLSGAGPKSMGRLKISFEYKAEDPAAARQSIASGSDRARSEVRLLLLGKTRTDLSSTDAVVRTKLEIQEILDNAFFAEASAKIADVYILELLFQ